MRTRLIAILTLLSALLAVPVATSSAAPLVGISENNPQVFADPHFENLLVTTTRLVVAYNTVDAAAKGDNELRDRIIPYLDAAKDEGTDVLVAFEHARGGAEVCNKRSNYRLSQCRLPSAKEYEKALRAFLTLRPDVHTIAPWNEANHFTQPTSRNPRMAAKFTDIATKICKQLHRKCTIMAADVLDAANNTKSRHPTYVTTSRWIKKFRSALRSKRTVCGIHNYSDVNRFRTSGVKALKKALKCKSYWLTETGGFYAFGSFWTRSTKKVGHCKTAAKCQVAATKFLFRHFQRDRSIKRIYIYTWFGGGQPRFDAGLVAGTPGSKTKPRPALSIVKKYI
jgi:hypothetical protein